MRFFVVFAGLFFPFLLWAQSQNSAASIEDPTPVEQEAETVEPEVPVFSNARDAFAAGVRFYQEQRYPQAVDSFSQALQMDSDNKLIAYNLGLAAKKVNRMGLAIGAFRRAHFLDPFFAAPEQHLKDIEKVMSTAKVDVGPSPFSKLHQFVVEFTPLDVALGLLFVFLLAAGWMFLKHLGLRKQAFEQELPLPPFPTKPAVFFALSLLMIAIVATKLLDLSQAKATVLPTKQALYTGPDEKSANLFELTSGQLVLMKKTEGEWSLVKYPGGFTGWVPKKNLFIHAGWVQ